MSADYQPRYVAFARAHGRTPDAQLAHDRQERPGGPMVDFMAWIDDQWSDWCREHDRPRHGGKSDADHAAFDAWLAARVAVMPELETVVTATDGKRYRVVLCLPAGRNTRRAAPSVAGTVGLVLASPRARSTYMGVVRTDGSIERGDSVGAAV